MKADVNTEAAVMAVMDKYNEAYIKRDLNGVLAFFAPDDDVIVIGTGVDEKRVGREEIKAQFERDFTQSEGASVEFTWHSVSLVGPVAWVAADCLAYLKVNGKEIKLPLRLTTVLELRRGKWLIMQSHASMPASGQAEGDSFPV